MFPEIVSLVFLSKVIVGANAESHTISMSNQCGHGTPFLLQNNITVGGSTSFTSNGPFTAGTVFLQTGNCGSRGENCTLIEMALQNSVSAADISLIPPSSFNVPVYFEFTNGCNGTNETCSNENCDTAFHSPTDDQATLICQDDDVGLSIIFCPGNSTSTGSSTSSSNTASTTQQSDSSSAPNTPTQTGSSDFNQQSSGQSDTAVIVGSVVGSVVGLAILLLAGFFCLKRRKAVEETEHGRHVEPLTLHVEPFELKPEINLPVAPITTSPISSKHLDQKSRSNQPNISTSSSPDGVYTQTITAPSLPQSVQPSPTSPITRSTTIRTERQMRLQTQADDLRDQVSQLGNVPGSTEVNMPDMQATVDRLVARIRMLEGQLNSDWAMGLSNDPPPTYTAA
ncbi:hypothetical protein VKT23_007557 [Stygiomarasmius scandens]|uniref:Uncharacterized protein n=1 Tax=Marasmiellus scandens TaxID=2682957 RepID=A0ABR1JQP2_9AGAR